MIILNNEKSLKIRLLKRLRHMLKISKDYSRFLISAIPFIKRKDKKENEDIIISLLKQFLVSIHNLCDNGIFKQPSDLKYLITILRIANHLERIIENVSGYLHGEYYIPEDGEGE